MRFLLKSLKNLVSRGLIENFFFIFFWDEGRVYIIFFKHMRVLHRKKKRKKIFILARSLMRFLLKSLKKFVSRGLIEIFFSNIFFHRFLFAIFFLG